MIECYCDASCDSNNCYYGFVIENSGNKYGDIGKLRKDTVSNNTTKSELRSMEILIDNIEKRFDDLEIILYSDCEGAVEVFNKDISFDREDLRIISDRIRRVKRKSNNNYKIRWIQRSENKAADRLADEARRSDNPEEYEKSFNRNWKIKRIKKNKYYILSKQGEVLCCITNNYCSCLGTRSEKCRHMFFLDRMLNKDLSHKIPEKYTSE